jgi:hypothetical protein
MRRQKKGKVTTHVLAVDAFGVEADRLRQIDKVSRSTAIIVGRKSVMLLCLRKDGKQYLFFPALGQQQV